VDVLVAVSERDAASRRQSAEPGRRCVSREGLSLREAVEWCGGEITLREATRLGRLVSDP
jgi:hypothetical protein